MSNFAKDDVKPECPSTTVENKTVPYSSVKTGTVQVMLGDSAGSSTGTVGTSWGREFVLSPARAYVRVHVCVEREVGRMRIMTK